MIVQHRQQTNSLLAILRDGLSRGAVAPKSFLDIFSQQIIIPGLGEEAINFTAIDNIQNGLQFGRAAEHYAHGIGI